MARALGQLLQHDDARRRWRSSRVHDEVALAHNCGRATLCLVVGWQKVGSTFPLQLLVFEYVRVELVISMVIVRFVVSLVPLLNKQVTHLEVCHDTLMPGENAICARAIDLTTSLVRQSISSTTL